MRPAISVLLPTYNCAATVRNTLRSIQWADEILVVDSYSTDETTAICKQYGAVIVQHEYLNSAKQKNWAAPQCRHEWVLQVDSDEVLEEGLREELEHVLTCVSDEVHAFRMPRKNHVLGRWLRYGGLYPDYQVRAFRRAEGRWAEREVHAHLAVSGRVETLRNGILHYGMSSLSKPLGNLDRYTRYEADELRKQGNGFRWWDLLIRPWAAFLYRYLWLQGFRDGWRGFMVSAFHAIYVLLSRAKLWEMQELGLERSPDR